MRIRSVVVAALLSCVAFSVSAEPAQIAAAVAAPDRPANMRKLDASRKPVQVLQFLGLKRGDHALDLFGSIGYYGVIMARAVGPEGSVESWESSNFVNAEVRRVWSELQRRIPNLKLIESPAAHIKLPENTYDFVMFNLNYHDLYWQSEEYRFPRMDPKPFVRAIYRSMKPGATLAVIDHVANPGGGTRDVAQELHRIDPATVRSDFQAVGFTFEGESPLLRNPADDHRKSVFDPSIRFHTDQIIYRFRKPA